MKKVLFFLLLFGGMVALLGCTQVREDEVTRPWTEPEPWERNVDFGGVGAPFGQP